MVLFWDSARVDIKIITVLLFAAVAAALTRSLLNPSRQKMTAEEFGATWPIAVSEGYVECRRGDAFLICAPGKVYGLNGFGDTFFATEDLHEIRKRDPQHPDQDLYMNIEPLIEVAEAQC